MEANVNSLNTKRISTLFYRLCLNNVFLEAKRYRQLLNLRLKVKSNYVRNMLIIPVLN
jgi:hypothetical protein